MASPKPSREPPCLQTSCRALPKTCLQRERTGAQGPPPTAPAPGSQLGSAQSRAAPYIPQASLPLLPLSPARRTGPLTSRFRHIAPLGPFTSCRQQGQRKRKRQEAPPRSGRRRENGGRQSRGCGGQSRRGGDKGGSPGCDGGGTKRSDAPVPGLRLHQ